MKSLLRALTVTVVTVGLMGGTAAADTTTCNGNISGTGTGSTNTVTCIDDEETQVTCVNNIVVEISNDQSASSGGAFTTGNTTGGDANSGDSDNDNTVVVQLGASCAPVVAATVATPPAPTPTPQVLADTTVAPQVVTPAVAAVHAGGGAGTSNNTQLAGLVGSLGIALTGAAFLIRKRVLGQ